MTPERRIPRLARWAVPAGAIALTGIVGGGYAISGAPAAPSLPARTPVQLVASVSSADVPPPMTGVIQETASLGFPDLPGTGNRASPLSWLTGTHTYKLWYADPAHVRIAVPVQLGESDVRRDGRDVWFWNSQNSQVTHLVLPPGAAQSPGTGESPQISGAPPSPQQVARQVLAAVGPTTKVGLQQNVMIAGQAAYQISLAPRDSRSLIGQVRIAVDARHALPLRVQIFARGASAPAFQVGFTSLQYGTPAAANFAFTPPPGAKVKTVTVPSGPPGGPASRGTLQERTTGNRMWLTPVPKGAPKLVVLPAHSPYEHSPYEHSPYAYSPYEHSRYAYSPYAYSGKLKCPVDGPGPATFSLGSPAMPGPLPASAPRVLGKGWLTVLALPAATIPPRAGPGVGLGMANQAGRDLAILGELLRTATPVHGSWGSGRLLTTSLLSVLSTSDGELLVGAVSPAVLYADAAQLK